MGTTHRFIKLDDSILVMLIVEELNRQLDIAIHCEEFETASAISGEMGRRESRGLIRIDEHGYGHPRALNAADVHRYLHED